MKRKPLLALVPGVALSLAAVLLLYPSRQTNGHFSRVISDEGIEMFEFASSMAPAIPENVRQTGNLAALLALPGLKVVAGDIAVDPLEGGGFRWTDERGWQISVFAKQCEDGIACVDRVEVRPDDETRLRNIATADPRAKLIEPAHYDDWPFLPALAVLRCEPPNALTLRSAEGLFALNGPGRRPDTQPISGILKDHPLRPGTKVAFGPVFFDAMALCD